MCRRVCAYCYQATCGRLAGFGNAMGVLCMQRMVLHEDREWCGLVTIMVTRLDEG